MIESLGVQPPSRSLGDTIPQATLDRLKMALNRLTGAPINTDIETGGERIQEGFGIIDWWRIIEKSPLNKRMVCIEIKLSDWLYRAVLSYEVPNP